MVGTLCLAGLVQGCLQQAGGGRTSANTPFIEGAEDRFEAPGLLLLMADQLLFEPFAVRTIFRQSPEHHRRLAMTLGRTGDRRGLSYLQTLVRDPNVEVRRAAAFALGQLGDLDGHPALLGALGDRDPEVGSLAVRSLARLGLPLERILAAQGVLSGEEGRLRLLPTLFRFAPDEIHAVAAALPASGSDLDRWLIYALGRSGDTRALPRLRSGLNSPDPWARGWAARGLGRLGDRSDPPRLFPLLRDSDAGVVVQVLRATASLIDAGVVAPPEDWFVELERLIEDESSWVRLTAIESAGSWLPRPRLAARLRALAGGGGRGGELALMSLARWRDQEAEQFILRAAAAPTASRRRAAAPAAAAAGLETVLAALSRDPVPAVRMAVLSAVLESEDQRDALGLEGSAREALLDPDPGVRALALEWLAANPVAPLDELLAALRARVRRPLLDLRINGCAALAARAADEPLERGAIVAALERFGESQEFLVRRAAGDALVLLERQRPPLGTVAVNRSLREYRALASRMASSAVVELTTSRGVLWIRLDLEAAPLTALSFLELVGAGFYDGLVFHRVIPDFVVQGGDPRGDGWGGPGFSLRDENNPTRFKRGVVGMARSGTHTAGSQFFMTLSEQPHLNGSYTAFGRVVRGDELLDAIEQGDRIEEMRVLSESEIGGTLGS